MKLDMDFLKSEPARAFVQKYRDRDPNKLLLNPPQGFGDHIALLVEQIVSRAKARGKLDSWLRKDEVIFPPPLSIEQSSSQAAADYKSSLISGDHLIDLTGGMGVDCMALSRSFTTTTFVERSGELCDLFRWNAQCFDVTATIVHGSAEQFVSELAQPLPKTLVYLDPARRRNSGKTVLLQDCEPNALELVPAILDKGMEVLLKTSPLLDIKSVLMAMKHVTEVHVVAMKNEVKEVLFRFSHGSTATAKIVTMNLGPDQLFVFDYDAEARSEANLGEVSRYLFEPNAAILKAGAFKSICTAFNLLKLDTSTHLYTSDTANAQFPGKTFEVIKALKKADMKTLAGQKINVISRNHPLSAPALKKKFSISDGGSEFLVATRSLGRPIFLHCRLETPQSN